MKHILVARLLLILFLAAFFVASLMYPMCSDDFLYSFVFQTDEHVQGISDIIRSQSSHYFLQNGRFWTHCVVQYLLQYDKWLFALINVFVYGTTTYIISRICLRSHNIWLWLIIAMTLWCVMPHSGSSIFWLTGSINYLWAGCLNIIFLYVILRGKKAPYWLAIPFSCIAGNAHEGLSICFLGAALILLLLRYRDKIYIYSIILAYAAGFILNVIAPGNYVRLGESDLPLVLKLYFNGKSLLFTLIEPDFSLNIATCMLIVSSLACMWLLYTNRRKAIFLGSLVLPAIVYLCFAGYIGKLYSRVFFPFCFISYIGFIASIILILKRKHIKYAGFLFLGAAVLLNFVEIPKAYTAIKALRETTDHVQKKLDEGETIISFPASYEKADWRYMEAYGFSRNASINRPLSLFYNKSDFIVLHEDEAATVRGIVASCKDLKPEQIKHFENNYHIVKLPTKPKRVSVSTRRVRVISRYRFKFVREALEKHKQESWASLDCTVFCVGSDYYALWRSGADMKYFRMRVNGVNEECFNYEFSIPE